MTDKTILINNFSDSIPSKVISNTVNQLIVAMHKAKMFTTSQNMHFMHIKQNDWFV